MSGQCPPIRKSSTRSWNCPWMSPQTVTGHFTGCTLDSSTKISRAYETTPVFAARHREHASFDSFASGYGRKRCVPSRKAASPRVTRGACSPSTAQFGDPMQSIRTSHRYLPPHQRRKQTAPLRAGVLTPSESCVFQDGASHLSPKSSHLSRGLNPLLPTSRVRTWSVHSGGVGRAVSD